jgi:hypothetical protein
MGNTMVKAHYTGTARQLVRAEGNRVRKEKEIRGTEEFDLNPGDGNARVEVTRGFKIWHSNRDAGITVEATISVSLTCNQDEKTIKRAADKAGDLAENRARKGAETMREYLNQES